MTTRSPIRFLALLLVAVAALAGVGIYQVGRGESTFHPTWLASDDSGAILLNWVKGDGHNVSGSVAIVVPDPDAVAVTRKDHAFHGTIDGRTFTLDFSDGTPAWSGTVSNEAITLTYPQNDGSQGQAILAPSSSDSFNAELAVVAASGGVPAACTAIERDSNMVITSKSTDCNAVLSELHRITGLTLFEPRSDPDTINLLQTCSLHSPEGMTVKIIDSGYQNIARSVCQELRAAHWTATTAPT